MKNLAILLSVLFLFASAVIAAETPEGKPPAPAPGGTPPVEVAAGGLSATTIAVVVGVGLAAAVAANKSDRNDAPVGTTGTK